MDNSNFDGNILTVTSFFGALTFTVMVLLIQFSNEIQYSEIIIPWMGLVSFFFDSDGSFIHSLWARF